MKVRNEETNETKEFPVDDLVREPVYYRSENHIGARTTKKREVRTAKTENHVFAEVRTTKRENHAPTKNSSEEYECRIFRL